jgi:hypothetical protein
LTRHGDIDGINCKKNIKPEALLKEINGVPGLTDGLLVLGQCFSGIFNMPKQSKVCVIGASNFYPSISSPNIENSDSWIANVFLYYFAKWLREPYDVDGDDQNTILDAYKYTSYHTNLFLTQTKIDSSKTFDKWCTQEYIDIIQKPQNLQSSLDYVQRMNTLDNKLPLYHNHQEAWISDYDVALRLIIK